MKKLLTAVAVAGLAFGTFAADEQDYTQWVTLTNSDYYTSSTKCVYSFAKKSAINYWSDVPDRRDESARRDECVDLP